MIADYTPPTAIIRPFRRETEDSSFPSFEDDELLQRDGRYIRRESRRDTHGCGNALVAAMWTRSLADAAAAENRAIEYAFDSIRSTAPAITADEAPTDDLENDELEGTIFAAPVPMNILFKENVHLRISNLCAPAPFLKLDPDDLGPPHDDEF